MAHKKLLARTKTHQRHWTKYIIKYAALILYCFNYPLYASNLLTDKWMIWTHWL